MSEQDPDVTEHLRQRAKAMRRKAMLANRARVGSAALLGSSVLATVTAAAGHAIDQTSSWTAFGLGVGVFVVDITLIALTLMLCGDLYEA